VGQDGDESVLSRQYGGQESRFSAEGGGGGEEVFVIWSLSLGDGWIVHCMASVCGGSCGGRGFVRASPDES